MESYKEKRQHKFLKLSIEMPFYFFSTRILYSKRIYVCVYLVLFFIKHIRKEKRVYLTYTASKLSKLKEPNVFFLYKPFTKKFRTQIG